MTKKNEECLYWQELRMIAADREFDGGEFSASREPEEMQYPDLCGKCQTCRDYEKACEDDPWLFEEWRSSSEAADFDDGVLRHMERAHSNEIHNLKGWNQLASQCVMEVVAHA